MNEAPKQLPKVKGLNWHRHQYYSFFTPKEWTRFAWTDGREGEIYGPDPADPATVYSVEITDLGMKIEPSDLDDLAEGFFTTIEQLPEAEIELRNQKVTGSILQLEAKYCYRVEDKTRKCWARVFYQDSRQIAMIAQGETVEKYNYWLPWFYEAMMTARIHRQTPGMPAGSD